ncbi:hypothetical protein LCGC14_2452240 [marine sediment metagenome]|uniref:DUF7948 domain-containing protein n=1 Tax=marine sediment metagenome TaxID=412755 RepID=A0A0F9DSX3_9ZZZZ
MAARLRIGLTTANLAMMLAGLLGAAMLTVALAASHGSGSVVGSVASPEAAVQEAMAKLPLYFIKNEGQADRRVSYYLQGGNTSLYFTSKGVTFALTEKGETSTAANPGAAATPKTPAPGSRATNRRWAVKQEFLGANPASRPSGQQLTDARVSYFKGPRSKWKTDLPTYSKVTYPDLWPGIDLVYSGNASKLEYTMVVKPGADPEQIRLAYRGASSVKLNSAGQLAISTPVGGFRDDKPFAYQRTDGQRVQVPADYDLASRARAGSRSYGFNVGAYDKTKPLVIDPVVLDYAGYIGGSGDDEGNGIAVDASGSAYVTGQTNSTEASFPKTVGPDLTYNGGSDAFVAKVKADGTGLDYAGYIGGSNPTSG